MGACRSAERGDGSADGSYVGDVELGRNCQTKRHHARGRDEKIVLQCCALFALLTTAVLVTVDTRRITWVLHFVPRESPVPFSKAYAFEDSVEDILMKGLEFLETDPNQRWDHDAIKEDRGMLIPRILHHVFLDGEDEYTRMTEKAKLEGSGMRREYRDSCISHHSNWTYMFWDKAAAVELLRSRYPWFTKTFLSYEFVVSQGDALRPFLMHAFGGLYLDLDVSCYRSSEPFLLGHDIVFQSEFSGEADVNNAVVASVPGHPFWNAVIRNITLGARTADETNILSTTGPWVWREAFRPWVEITRSHPPYGGEYVVHGAHIKYYPLGEWFNPCTYADEACHAKVDLDAAAGRADPLLAGHHKFKSSWVPVVDAAGDAKATAKAQAKKEELAKKEERARKEEVAEKEELAKAIAAEEGAAENEAAGAADDKRGGREEKGIESDVREREIGARERESDAREKEMDAREREGKNGVRSEEFGGRERRGTEAEEEAEAEAEAEAEEAEAEEAEAESQAKMEEQDLESN